MRITTIAVLAALALPAVSATALAGECPKVVSDNASWVDLGASHGLAELEETAKLLGISATDYEALQLVAAQEGISRPDLQCALLGGSGASIKAQQFVLAAVAQIPAMAHLRDRFLPEAKAAVASGEARKAEARRKSGYRDPGASSLCKHMTDNGCADR